MTPERPDRDTLQRRLRLMDESLEALSSLESVTTEDLVNQPLTRAAAERLLQVIVDLAFDINTHLAVAITGRVPETGRETFLVLGEAEVIPSELAVELAPSAGLRNVLVHQYIDIRPELVTEAIGQTLHRYPEYVEAIASYLART